MDYLSTQKAAKKLGIYPNTVRKWADSGKIKYFRTLSGQRRYDIDGYLGIHREAKVICYCRVSSRQQPLG